VVYTISKRFGQVNDISTDELETRQNNGETFLIVDTRREDEYAVSRLPGAKHLFFKSEDEKVDRFLVENVGGASGVVCYCSLGYRSSVMAEKIAAVTNLEDLKVYNLEGSIFKWANENKPLEGQGVHPFSYFWALLTLDWSKWKWTPEE